MDNVKTGLILKDVSLEVHSGEVLAVLGSKGWLNVLIRLNKEDVCRMLPHK